MLELKDATLTVAGHQLFEKLSLMALDGQLTCITGPAGCGKTALVRAMLGFLPLDEGLVSIDGELLTPLSAPAFRGMMAYLPQQREVMLQSVTTDLEGPETVWSPHGYRPYQPTLIDEHLDLPAVASRSIIIADDPDLSQLNMLKSLTAGKHTVVVATQREEYLNISEKIITLGNNDTLQS